MVIIRGTKRRVISGDTLRVYAYLLFQRSHWLVTLLQRKIYHHDDTHRISM